MRIHDVIAACDDGTQQVRDASALTTIAIHRVGRDLATGVELGRDAVSICRRFVHDPAVARYTGGQNAYTLMVGEQGEIWQCLPLHEVGHHARRWNRVALGIGVIGDFRYERPTQPQLAALEDLCAELCLLLGLRPSAVRAHDELPGGSRDPAKACPGRLLSVEDLRPNVRAAAASAAARRLADVGMVL